MVNQTKQNKAREKNEYSNFGYIKFLHSTVLFRGDSNKAAHHLYIDFNIGSSSKHACCRLFFIHGLFSLSPSLSLLLFSSSRSIPQRNPITFVPIVSFDGSLVFFPSIGYFFPFWSFVSSLSELHSPNFD